MIVYIEWVDAASMSGWATKDAIEEHLGLVVCNTVGHLCYEDDERYVVSCTLSKGCNDEGCEEHLKYADPFAIPKIWVKVIKEVTWV